MAFQVILYTINFLKEAHQLIWMLKFYGNKHIYFYQSKEKSSNL